MAMARAHAVVASFLVLAALAAVDASATTLVAGMVFCDQCKDGARSIFDYPLYGARVAIQCDGDGEPVTVREGTANWFGGFSVRMEGAADLTGCRARVVEGTGRCGAASGPPRELALAFRMFGLSLYTVPPLLSQPEEPTLDFCRRREWQPRPHPPAVASPPTVQPPPMPLVSWHFPPLPPAWRMPSTPLLPPPPRPANQLPSNPRPSTPPPSPLEQGSACSYDKWIRPEHKCYWKVVSPDTTVAMAFGPLAAARYGPEMTLREALQGRGDINRTLLREATAALLNSYYNGQQAGGFLYPSSLSVIDHMNRALLGSAQRVLLEAARFRRANAGGGGRARLACRFSPCSP